MSYTKQCRVYILLLFLGLFLLSNNVFGQERKLSIEDARKAAIAKAMQARKKKEQGHTMAAEILEKRNEMSIRGSDTTAVVVRSENKKITQAEIETNYLEKLQAHRTTEEEQREKAKGELPEPDKNTTKETLHKEKIEQSIRQEEERLASVKRLMEQEEAQLATRQKNVKTLREKMREDPEHLIAAKPEKPEIVLQDSSDGFALKKMLAAGEEPVAAEISPNDSPQVEEKIADFIAEKKVKKAWKPLMLESYNFSMENYKGKVVVMNYWFGDCKMCLQEMPRLNQLVEKYENENIVFLGMTTDMPEKAIRVAKKQNFKYKIVPMARPIAEKMWVVMYPTHIVFDKNGERVVTLTGNAERILQELEEAVAEVLEKE